MSRFEHFGFGVPWEDLNNYSQAVRAGDRLFVSGQVAHDSEGNFLGEGDITVQTEATLANLDRVLQRFGAERSDVVETNIFLVDLRTNFAPAMAVCKRYFGDHRPASNAFGVVALVLEPQLIEISAHALLRAS
jgi:enamine deaminase RidA (YjgF/YER057c/UK114 family)